MKIAIAGAGMAGSYLYRLLKEEGHQNVDLYDVQKTNRCGQKPCAWGFAPSPEYRRLLSKFIEPDHYVLHRADSIIIDGVRLRADLVTADKAKLIDDLIEGVGVRYSPLDVDAYDRIIDATGVSRAFLGPVNGQELIADCVQYRVRAEESLDLWFKTTTLGYEWCFPLGNGEYHIGFGDLRSSVNKYRPDSFVDPTKSRTTRLCRCTSKVRLSSPYHSQPFVSRGKIVGVGESIGTVAPLGADGNLYALQCAEMLMNNWDDLDAYAALVLKRYNWMKNERHGLEKLRQGRMPSPMDIRTFLGHSKRVGVEMDPRYALSLFRKFARN